MSIRARSPRTIEFDNGLERRAPQKVTLVRANPYTCSCAEEGRTSPAIACSTCNGTGYTGGVRGVDLRTAGAPYNSLYYIFADVQPGHGLYGNGGDFLFTDPDIGKLEVGDAVLFTKIAEFDLASGKSISPEVSPTLVRPDKIIATDGTPYTVTKSLRGNLGSEDVFRMFVLQQGDQGTKR